MATRLVLAQGALGNASHHRDLALSYAMSAEDAHDRAGVAPLACFKEVLTCENPAEPFTNFCFVYRHGRRPVPKVACFFNAGGLSSQSHIHMTRCYTPFGSQGGPVAAVKKR
jgi:hypothetical protein